MPLHMISTMAVDNQLSSPQCRDRWAKLVREVGAMGLDSVLVHVQPFSHRLRRGACQLGSLPCIFWKHVSGTAGLS